MNITKKDLSFITITEILLIIKTNLGVYRFMPIWHQSPKLTPRYFLETPRLFGYPNKDRITGLSIFSFHYIIVYQLQ